MIKRIIRADKKTLEEINALMGEWSLVSRPLAPAYFKKLITESCVLGLYDKGVLVGTATIIPMYKLSGLKGSVEHVIVSEKYRGQGLGEKLMRVAIAQAKKLKMKSLFLTCEPDRAAAKKLYAKLGFTQKDTGFYQLTL